MFPNHSFGLGILLYNGICNAAKIDLLDKIRHQIIAVREEVASKLAVAFTAPQTL